MQETDLPGAVAEQQVAVRRFQTQDGLGSAAISASLIKNKICAMLVAPPAHQRADGLRRHGRLANVV
jgi:hypothetical protein